MLLISHCLIRYESINSRGHKIDGTKPNQTRNTFGEKKEGKQTEGNRQESSQQRTSSPSGMNRDTKERKNKNKIKYQVENKTHKQK